MAKHQKDNSKYFVLKECETCGKTLKVYKSVVVIGGGRFCSKSCFGKSRVGGKNTFYGRNHTEKTKREISEHHKKIGLKPKEPFDHTGMVRSEETRRKMSLAHSGENHYRWNPDREEIFKNADGKNDFEYREWRTKVYQRDNYECRFSSCKCSGRTEAHHILNWVQYPELRYEVKNGITLCFFHHPKGRKLEEKLAPVFNRLLLNV